MLAIAFSKKRRKHTTIAGELKCRSLLSFCFSEKLVILLAKSQNHLNHCEADHRSWRCLHKYICESDFIIGHRCIAILALHSHIPPEVSSHSDEGKHKRRRSVEDKKEKRKGKKSHRHSKHHSNKEMSMGKHRDKHHKRDRHLKPEFQELSNDDYYSKKNEFAAWLKEKRKIYFTDLSTESGRELFAEFAKDWKKHKLEPRYYEGIASGPRISHQWNIKQ